MNLMATRGPARPRGWPRLAAGLRAIPGPEVPPAPPPVEAKPKRSNVTATRRLEEVPSAPPPFLLPRRLTSVRRSTMPWQA
jgi:hypothetical protein